MSRDDAISWEHTLGVLPFLDQLQLGFVLIDPAGSLVHLSYIARRMLGRRARIARVAEVLGDAWPALVDDVIAGRSPGGRWRELRAPGADDGDELLVAARSTAVTQADGRVGVLVSLFDVSAEVGMHARYKDALAQLEAANQGLRRRIAEVLREHEDDLAQFDELLAIAPAIFASFVAEAREAVAEVAALVGGDTLSAAAADVGMRATHTLKGNARGLGLNSIAGRAHAVEELLGRARAAGRFADRVDADGAVEDLRRAVERAVVL
ncbi:MAG: Hpt domain-containing protein, partial [Myxococcales bacterium]|nr:Hpt domain-containing protein [Myxococcales bacterium]